MRRGLSECQLHPKPRYKNGQIIDARAVRVQIECWAKDGNTEQVLAWSRYCTEEMRSLEISMRYWAEEARLAKGGDRHAD